MHNGLREGHHHYKGRNQRDLATTYASSRSSLHSVDQTLSYPDTSIEWDEEFMDSANDQPGLLTVFLYRGIGIYSYLVGECTGSLLLGSSYKYQAYRVRPIRAY